MLSFSDTIVMRMRLAIILNTQTFLRLRPEPQKGTWSLLNLTSNWNSRSSLGSFKILSPNPKARRRLAMLWGYNSPVAGLCSSQAQQAGAGLPKSIPRSCASQIWLNGLPCSVMETWEVPAQHFLVTGSIWTLIARQQWLWHLSKTDRKKVNIK